MIFMSPKDRIKISINFVSDKLNMHSVISRTPAKKIETVH